MGLVRSRGGIAVALFAAIAAAAIWMVAPSAQTQTPPPETGQGGAQQGGQGEAGGQGQSGEEIATVFAGEFEPLPIGVPIFVSVGAENAELAQNIAEVVAADLDRSGLFRLIGGPSLASIDVPPPAASWRALGAESLVAGEVSYQPDGRLSVRFRLWSLDSSEQLVQLQFLSDPTGWRRVAHKVADAVYEALIGEGAYFDTRIVFVAEDGPKNNRRKRLAIMDQDGANLTYLTDGQHLVLTPRFSPVTQEITFISYESGRPEVHLLNLQTEVQEAIGFFEGMSFAPRFSPDGERVVMSLARGSGSDIFLMELATRRTRRLTNSPGIDTSPSFAPDGSAIVFESDRGGSQQLYIMSADGRDVRRISRGDGRYATPVWSPQGDLIAFTKVLGGRFYIGVMTPEGEQERLLSSSFLDEGPTWAPNGRVLMFYRETPGAQGLPQLYVVDAFGRAPPRRVPTPAGASDPAWSPLLSP